jgi:3'-5' exoribonuclease
MPRAKPQPVRLCEVSAGTIADFFAMLAEKRKSATRDGKPFYNCRFRDTQRTVSYMAWADGPHFEACERDWQEGRCYKIRAAYGEHEKYGPQIEIQMIRQVQDGDEVEGFDPKEFVDHSRHDSAKMFAELKVLAETHIGDPPLKKLVQTILEKYAEPLQRLPATQGKFYPFHGGLLEHTLSVTWSCLQLAEKYAVQHEELTPPINKDLVVAGAILHDIGRVLELDDNPLSPQPTIPGRLFGHLFLGRDLVRETAREIEGINPELVQLLEHMIITHLNLPAWGSPRLPLIPECLILHHADDLDAKLEMYVRCLSRDQSQGPFTNRDPVLDRQLLKGRTV